MPTTEIEKLERRYAENPQGLTFAPLAEVHRKNGDIARALELLRAGLELHPNYIPASIVLGRCHWDLGDLPAAEAAFAHVLRLDDENVIALKSLADINERLERFGDAQRWLNRLISIDRSNEEARQQLARIEAAKQSPSKPAVLPHEMAAAPESAQEVSPAPADLPVKQAEAVQEPAPASEPKAVTLEFLDTTEPAQPSTEPSEPPSEPASVDGLISQEFVPPKDNTYRSHPELTQQFDSAGDLQDILEVETASEVELHSSGATEFRVPNAAEDFMEAELEPPPAPALDLIHAQETPQNPPEILPEPKGPSYSVRETKGQSVAAFFQVLLAARPKGAVESSSPAQVEAPEGSTSRGAPAGSGQQSPAPAEDGLTAPAVPAAGDSPELAVSFDDFFKAPTGGSSPLPKASADPGKDDLDQFQSWLQNLKR